MEVTVDFLPYMIETYNNVISLKSMSSFSLGASHMVYCISYMEVTVDFLPYMIETVGKRKKRQNMAK